MPKATQEQIDAWKQLHGDVFEVRVDGKFGYLKSPDRKTVAKASALQASPIRSNEAMLEGCWIGGDDEIKKDDKLFLAVQSKLGALMEVKEAELVKL